MKHPAKKLLCESIALGALWTSGMFDCTEGNALSIPVNSARGLGSYFIFKVSTLMFESYAYYESYAY
jgi:hypothetical protein